MANDIVWSHALAATYVGGCCGTLLALHISGRLTLRRWRAWVFVAIWPLVAAVGFGLMAFEVAYKCLPAKEKENG